MKKIITAIDLGTETIKGVCGSVYSDRVELLSHASVSSVGIRNGQIIDLNSLRCALSEIIKKLSNDSGKKIKSVYLNISNPQIKSSNSNGIAAIKDGVVRGVDVSKAMETAQTQALPTDLVLIHSFPQDYEIDGQVGILQPLNMQGTRLEVKAHIVVGPKLAQTNIQSITKGVGVTLESLVFSPIAPSFSILTNEEKEIGSMAIDIGAGTADVVVFKDGTIQESFSLGFGGDLINRAISTAFSVTVKDAELLKLKYGSAITTAGNDDRFSIKRKSYDVESEFFTQELQLVINKICSDFIERKLKERIEPRLRSMIKSIVVTGGSSRMPELAALFGKSFDVSVRVGSPLEIFDFEDNEDWSCLATPEYSLVSGIFMFGAKYSPPPTKMEVIRNSVCGFIKEYL